MVAKSCGGRKDRLAVVAALNDVVRVAGKRQTGQAGHEGDAEAGGHHDNGDLTPINVAPDATGSKPNWGI
jgi:hypothetical protein